MTKMNMSIISKEVARSRWAELFLFLAVATATASSLSSVVADEAEVAYLQPTRRQLQLSDFYASNHRSLMLDDDEQPSKEEEEEEEEPDVASIINGTPTGGPLSYQVGLATDAGFLPNCGGSLIAPRVVLTAGHCTGYPTLNKVLINAYNLSSPPYGIVQASSYVIHPDYNSTTFENDIASDTGIISTISAVVSILLISLSVITYYTIRDHGVNCRVGRAVTSIGFDRFTFEQWRCLHVGTQVTFVAVIVFLFPVEMISFCNDTYEDFMVYANLVDHLLVLPLLGLGILSGVALTTKRYFQDKQEYPLHPDVEVAMQVFNAFGAFWALFDAVLRRHLTGDSNSALLLACRFFVNVVSIGFCFFLWRLMYNMRKSLNGKDWIRSTACQEVGELCPSLSKSSKSKSSKNDGP